MNVTTFGSIDTAIVCIIGLFIILGLIRGFTSDFLGFFTWFGAIFLAKISYPFIQPIIRQYVTSLFFAELLSVVIPFLVSLAILVAVVHKISRRIQGSIFGGLDRTLGVLSGIIRASIILSIMYMSILMYYKPGEKPEWLKQARLQPYLARCTKFLYHYVIPRNLFPKQVETHLFEKKYQVVDKTPDEHVRALSSPQPARQNRVKQQK